MRQRVLTIESNVFILFFLISLLFAGGGMNSLVRVELNQIKGSWFIHTNMDKSKQHSFSDRRRHVAAIMWYFSLCWPRLGIQRLNQF